MGVTSNDLNWKVFGTTPQASGQGASSTNPAAVCKTDASIQNKQQNTNQSVDEIPVQQSKQQTQSGIIAYIKSAVLLSDAKTDFDKPCKFKVEIGSKEGYSSSVTLQLWGTYKEQEYDLQCSKTIQPVNMVAEGEINLFYIDKYYDDVYGNGLKNVTVGYFLKVSMNGANDFTGSVLTLPSNYAEQKQGPAAAAKGAAKEVLSALFKEDENSVNGFDIFTDAAKPFKSVKAGGSDSVKTDIQPQDAASEVRFSGSDVSIATVSPQTATTAQEKLVITGVKKGTAEIEAKDSKKTHSKLSVAVYPEITKTVAVRLVHEKNYKTIDIGDAVIKDMLNKVYGQAACKFTLTRLPAMTVEFDISKDGKIDVETWMSDEMIIVRDACKDDSYDYNLFLVDNPSDGSCGFMSYNQRYGFIHPKNSLRPEQTIAHEIGHGAFSLVHKPADADNVMYNFTSTTAWRLRKDQWDKVNP